MTAEDHVYASGPGTVVNPTTVIERGDSWPRTPAAVSIAGILSVTVLEGIGLYKGIDGNHFYAALFMVGAICGIHGAFAPRFLAPH